MQQCYSVSETVAGRSLVPAYTRSINTTIDGLMISKRAYLAA
jgi:hypothetical protein